ncbi:MAG: hypothetical protein FJ144_08155 [Deltaproteobacteria bacterium]|nr:hypothetical protein [Deltaproteobacteria bacterium]
MDEGKIRDLLGEVGADSDFDLRRTIKTQVGATADGDPDAPTLLLQPENEEAEEVGGAEGLLDSGFELVEEVGRGGMSLVFRARQHGLDRDIAVKRLRSRRRESRSARWSFLSEALVTGQLEHPNVIPIYGISVDGSGELALGMKLTRGRTWAHVLREERAVPGASPETTLASNLRILLGVMNAVSFAHSRGVIHRDLKPENVMIGEFGEVLVLDWGLAVRFSDTEMGVRAPHCSSVRRPSGTPVYMAPEMVEARGDRFGPWTDVYLLGGLLHEILTGKPPHRGAKLVDVLRAAYESTPPIFGESVPVELQDACRRALAREPSDRFASVAEFRAAIEDYLQHQESVKISDRAARTLAECRATATAGVDANNRGELYARLGEAIAGFSQARFAWPESDVAAEGEEAARLLLAHSALGMGDLGTAESALRGVESDAGAVLAAQVAEAAAVRERTLRTTRRVGFALILVQVAVVVLLGVWGYFELRRFHYRSEVAALHAITPLAALAIRAQGTNDPEKVQQVVSRIAHDLVNQAPLRLTVIDGNGKLVADTDERAARLEDRSNRPEFEAAEDEGEGHARRWSDSLEQEMVYYALPVRDAEHRPTLYVRAGLPLSWISDQLWTLVTAVAIGLLTSLVVGSIATILLTRHLTRAIHR